MAEENSATPITGPNGQTLACHCRSVFWHEDLVVQQGRDFDVDTLSRQTLYGVPAGCCRWDIEPWLASRLRELGKTPDPED